MKYFKFINCLLVFQLLYISDFWVIRIIPLIIMIFFILRCNHFSISASEIFRINKLVILYVSIILLSLVRTNNPNSDILFILYNILYYILFVNYFHVGISYYIKTSEDVNYLFNQFIIFPFVILIILNCFLTFLGIRVYEFTISGGESIGDCVLLGYFGIHVSRVEFSLAGGFNNYSSYLGGLMAFACSLFLLKGRKTYKVMFFMLIMISLMLIDSRSAIYYPILIFLFILFLNRIGKARNLYFLSFLVILGPLLQTVLLPFLGDNPFFSWLSRGNDELSTGNSRFVIWLISLLHFLDFKIIHLVGYGDFGHFGSKVSLKWSKIFDAWGNSDMKTPHSTLFSLLFDYGYIGVISYLILLCQLFNRIKAIWVINKYIAYPCLAFLIYNIIAGISESLNGIYSPNYFILFLFISIFINCYYTYKVKMETSLEDVLY